MKIKDLPANAKTAGRYSGASFSELQRLLPKSAHFRNTPRVPGGIRSNSANSHTELSVSDSIVRNAAITWGSDAPAASSRHFRRNARVLHKPSSTKESTARSSTPE